MRSLVQSASRHQLRKLQLSTALQRPAVRFASFYDDRFRLASEAKVAKATFQSLLHFNRSFGGEEKLIESANLLQYALPVRLAKCIVDMQSLPYRCMLNPHMQTVHDAYVTAFDNVVAVPFVKTIDEEIEWNGVLRENMERTRVVLPVLAKASKEISQLMSKDALEGFLDNFLSSRIARRVLAEQHLAFHDQYFNPENFDVGDIGTISMHCDPTVCAKKSFAVAAKVCKSAYGCAPELVFEGPEPKKFCYISRHVEYMLLEIFKNAVRATVERALEGGSVVMDEDLPPITISIFCDAQETTFKIIDKGGGIPRWALNKVFDYAFSTIDAELGRRPTQAPISERVLDMASRPIAGEGFGLPLVRAYAKHFGGGLEIQSLYGHGAEVYLRLVHLDRNQHLGESYASTDDGKHPH